MSVALMSFEEQSDKSDWEAGFVHYADSVSVAEQKIAHAGVVMTVEEKREKFYEAFNPRSASWNTIKKRSGSNRRLWLLTKLSHGAFRNSRVHMPSRRKTMHLEFGHLMQRLKKTTKRARAIALLSAG